MRNGRVDLHVHTTASDGLYGPREVVGLAAEAGLEGLAIVDHDSIQGLEEAEEEGRRLGVEVVRGVELTTYRDRTELHILGLFMGEMPRRVAARLGEFRSVRRKRMQEMIRRLGGLGVDIAEEDVFSISPGAVGRPHLAEAIVRNGYAESIDQAFARYLREDGPVYVRKTEMDPLEAIRLIESMGGVSVLAHPGTKHRDELLGEFKEAGLVGVEVWHPRHKSADVQHYRRLAAKHGFLPSGGSDFHGPGRSATPVGVPEVRIEVMEALSQAHAASAAKGRQ